MRMTPRPLTRKEERAQLQLFPVPGLPHVPTPSLIEHYEIAKGTIAERAMRGGFSPQQFQAYMRHAVRRLHL